MVAKLERIAVDAVWKNEVAFTRWLEENCDVLSDVVDFQIVSANREQPAGEQSKFNVDLVAEDAEGNIVVVENQLYKSDHDHLGKLITYLTAVDARRAIWIVADPRPEHVRAVTWLNESSSVEFYFLKLEAIKVGDSEPAPLLTLIVGPSDESKAAGETKKKLAESHTLRHRFWSQLLERAKAKTKLHAAISPSSNGYVMTGAGKAGLGFAYVIRQNADADVELYIQRGLKEENKSIFRQLEENKPEIEQRFGMSLEWEPLEGKRACRIRSFVNSAGYDDESKWPALQDAMIDRMMKLERALRPEIEKIKIG